MNKLNNRSTTILGLFEGKLTKMQVQYYHRFLKNAEFHRIES